MLNDAELNALLDAHDALVSACVEERLTLDQFLAAYNDFPRVYGLDGRGAGTDVRAVSRRFAQRIEFHRRVLDLVSGASRVDPEIPLDADIGAFLPRVTVLRLRQLVARYPDFTAHALSN